MQMDIIKSFGVWLVLIALAIVSIQVLLLLKNAQYDLNYYVINSLVQLQNTGLIIFKWHEPGIGFQACIHPKPW